MFEKKEKVCIFVDGGNFHHLALRKLGIKEQEFEFEEFALHLANGREICNFGKRYYVGTVREIEGNKRSKQAMSKQTRFLTTLNSYGWEQKTSKLMTRMERIIIDDRVVDYKKILKKGIKQIEYKRMREKGIDVKLATDLIVGALDEQYDTVIVVSSDTDLVPAMDWVQRRKNKKIEYIGFSIADRSDKLEGSKPSLNMIKRSDIQRVIVESDLKPFLMKGRTSLNI